MDRIKINDEYYVKENNQLGGKKIGIAITTHNRQDLIKKAVAEHKKFLPSNAVIFVIDDGSTSPVQPIEGVTIIRHNRAKGISHAKNKCLESLMDSGCDHLFLFDDDCWPKVSGWEIPYIESKDPHLAHSWNLKEIWSDSKHKAFHACGGTVLYYERHVIDKVGGMKHCFGKYGCEHVNLSDRIHNNSLTTWRYADVSNSDNLFYECDRYEKGQHKTAAAQADLDHNMTKGRELWLTMLDDTDFAPYREQHDFIITTLLTKNNDPQRGSIMRNDVSMIATLAASIKHGRLVVLHDSMVSPSLKTGAGEDVKFVKVEANSNPYFDRWVLIYQWLREQKNIRNAWIVDGTDVKQLRNPFTLNPNVLYVGQEQSSIKNKWLTDNCQSKKVNGLITESPHLTLLNPGTVGGDYQTVLSFTHRMVKEYFDDQIASVQCWDNTTLGKFDMGLFQYVCYQHFGDRIFYGPSVNTLFKGEKADEYAMWQHK